MTRNFAPPPPSNSRIAELVEMQLGHTPQSVSTIRGGAWSSAFAVSANNAEFVIRFSAIPDDFRIDQLAARFAGPNLPIPQVYGIGQLDQRWWCISQRMPGSHLDDLDANDLVQTIPSLADAMIAIRNVPAEGTTGYGGWDAHGNGAYARFDDQLLDVANDRAGERGSGWRERLAQHAHAERVFQRGLGEMEALLTYIPRTRQLIHQDLLNFNVTAVPGRITGIFDWGCAMWGDALYELAWFRFWWPWYRNWHTVRVLDELIDRLGDSGPHYEERMLAYLLHIGIGHIRYNAFVENGKSLAEVTDAVEQLLRREL